MKKLTLAQKKNYIEDTCNCPYCGSDNLTTESGVELDGSVGTMGVTCLDCERSWTDVYKLTSIYED